MEFTPDPITYSRCSCRICLGENATIPIFDEDNKRVLMMFNSSFNEKLEHVLGFPELVCASCYKTIETASSFIERYRETQQTLHQTVKIVKQEYIDEDDFNFPETDSIEDDIFALQYTDDIYDEDDIKTEPKCNDESRLSTNVLIKNDKLKRKTISGPKTNNKKSKKETNIFGALDINALFKDRPDLTIVKTEKRDTSHDKDRHLEPVVCDICNKKFLKKNSLTIHIKNVHNSEPVICSVCARILKNKKSLGKHMRIMHPGCVQQKQRSTMKNRINAVKKEKDFKTPTNLKEQPKKVYLCDECGENFETIDYLRQHKYRHQVPVVCDICNKTFGKKSSLIGHIKNVHNGDQRICPICARTLKNSKSLQSHIRMLHQGRVKKKHPRSLCTLCDRTFANKTHLLIHMRSVHTGERPEICNVCDKSFTCKRYMLDHMRLHTGETPFKCPVCGRGYAQRCNMKSHIVHNHRLSQIDPVLLAKIKPNYTRLMKP